MDFYKVVTSIKSTEYSYIGKASKHAMYHSSKDVKTSFRKENRMLKKYYTFS